MKFNIEVYGQKISGGWNTWNSATLSSLTDASYEEVRLEMIEKFGLEVGPRTKRMKTVSRDIKLGELVALKFNLFMQDNFSYAQRAFNDDRIMKIKIVEWK